MRIVGLVDASKPRKTQEKAQENTSKAPGTKTTTKKTNGK